MSFISVFDVLGPNMIGPSSSHTAGAAAIALLAGKMPNAAIKKADFILYGSFARTYKGHGTDRALLGGIMGFSTDDRRIPDSFSIADERGLQYSFTANTTETEIHPNTNKHRNFDTKRIRIAVLSFCPKALIASAFGLLRILLMPSRSIAHW